MDSTVTRNLAIFHFFSEGDLVPELHLAVLHPIVIETYLKCVRSVSEVLNTSFSLNFSTVQDIHESEMNLSKGKCSISYLFFSIF